MIPEESTTDVVKSFTVLICTRYDVAPVEEFHTNVGLVEMPVALSAGDARVGAAGAATIAMLPLRVDAVGLPSLNRK